MATNIIRTSFYGRQMQCVENILLSAVTTTGAGTTTPCKIDCADVTWQITVTGSPSATSTTLQVSNDGSTWVTIDTSTTTTEETRHIASNTYKYIRADLGTLTGGTTPTVTVRSIVKSP